MGIWDTLKGHAKAQFLDVIQWMEDDRDTMVYRYPVFNQAIQDGGKLVVREGQAAVFVNEGKLSEVFGPGTYEISTRTKAIWSFFESIKYQLNYPYKGDIFFVSTRRFTELRWGTPNPVMMRDAELGPVRIRAFGIYSFRIGDPGAFLRELVGNQGLFTTDEIQGQLKRKLVSAFADTVGEAKIPVLELAAQYMDLGDAMRERMNPWFQGNYGIQLTDFVVENISLPPDVEKMLDKRTSMGIIGNMGAYTQFQAANAIETAAAQPGGGNNPMMQAGMGMAMGNVMGHQMMQSQYGGPQHFQGNQPMPSAPPPPPPMGPQKLHYNGVGGQGQYTAAEVAGMVAANRAGAHHVWAPGWPGWKAWTDVPEVASQVPPDMPPPPSAAGPEPVYTYNGPSGQQESAPASLVRAALQADPGARHLVWQPGWSEWKNAADVPEIANAGGPPAPPSGGPPPPPM
jgi:membrane protease subunit (stomatin/prohibitin family)